MNTDKAAELLRQAADALSRPSSVSSGEEQKRFNIEQPSSSNAPVLRSPSVSDRVRGLFAPYSGFARKPSVGGPSWAHRFCALAIADQASNIVFRKKITSIILSMYIYRPSIYTNLLFWHPLCLLMDNITIHGLHVRKLSHKFTLFIGPMILKICLAVIRDEIILETGICRVN